MVICDGCNVNHPFEHKCHGDNSFVRGESTNKPCDCQPCRYLQFEMAVASEITDEQVSDLFLDLEVRIKEDIDYIVNFLQERRPAIIAKFNSFFATK